MKGQLIEFAGAKACGELRVIVLPKKPAASLLSPCMFEHNGNRATRNCRDNLGDLDSKAPKLSPGAKAAAARPQDSSPHSVGRCRKMSARNTPLFWGVVLFPVLAIAPFHRLLADELVRSKSFDVHHPFWLGVSRSLGYR